MKLRKSSIQFKFAPGLLTIFTLGSFAICRSVHAVVPPPDGGYPNFNTAEGTNALKNLATGAGNTAIGWYSLSSDTSGGFNTALGAGTLLFNNADANTAVGTAALLLNTAGEHNTAIGTSALLNNTIGYSNTAIGSAALSSNTEGRYNTAIGETALLDNTTGQLNTAIAAGALNRNTTGVNNTAVGYIALLGNTTGNNNIAVGSYALASNDSGIGNSAIGYQALSYNFNGDGNTAIGYQALFDNTTGHNNTALGVEAGFSLTGDNNVCIGAGVHGVAGEYNTTRISNIWGQPGGTQAVYVDADGRLGMNTSSRRFKGEIRPMDKTSEAIYSLKPVSFRYKREIEPTRPLSFGLIAEDVEQINANLVLRDKDGKASTVRYEAVNAMLLNEFLKEHRKNEEQGATIAQLGKDLEATAARHQKQIEALTAGLQRVSAQIAAASPSKDGLELVKAVPQTASNNH